MSLVVYKSGKVYAETRFQFVGDDSYNFVLSNVAGSLCKVSIPHSINTDKYIFSLNGCELSKIPCVNYKDKVVYYFSTLSDHLKFLAIIKPVGYEEHMHDDVCSMFSDNIPLDQITKHLVDLKIDLLQLVRAFSDTQPDYVSFPDMLSKIYANNDVSNSRYYRSKQLEFSYEWFNDIKNFSIINNGESVEASDYFVTFMHTCYSAGYNFNEIMNTFCYNGSDFASASDDWMDVDTVN